MERGPPDLSMANLDITYPKTTEEMVEAARAAFYDVNETDNLLNVLEAGQTVRSMLQVGDLMVSIKKTLKGLITGAKSQDKARRIRSSDVSSMYLGWSFGFAPLLSDLRKLASQLPRLRGNLKKLAKNTTQPISVVRSCDGDLAFVPPSGSGYGTWGGLYTDYEHWWKEHLMVVTKPRLTAGVHGTRNIQYSSAGFQEIDYLLQKYIATGPISLAWEKVKFSFAVDWFANLTGVIDTMDNVLTGHRKRIDYAWSSQKYHVVISAILGTYGDRDYDGIVGKPVAQFDIKRYHRSPADVDITPQSSGRFGKKQATLSVALLHQMVANLRR
jgi:hypothetical protein